MFRNSELNLDRILVHIDYLYIIQLQAFNFCLPVTDINTEVVWLGGKKLIASGFNLIDINRFTQLNHKPETKDRILYNQLTKLTFSIIG